ncbi:MAG: AMP-binding protein [Rhodocyclaceae bacterium]|nr:AMP-binding protein [Rhodocyclaceae bacterium]
MKRACRWSQVYGSTETCPIAAYIKVKDAERKAGSAGKPARHCRLRIADDLGKDVPQGTTGEILVQGHNVMAGYWNAPEATAAVLQNGWFHTGDMGHLDAEGYLYVDGRRKEMIISGGENIYPAEIENVLLESPDIAEASVVGRADARWGEIVVAVVAPKDGCSLSAEQGPQAARGPHCPLQASQGSRLRRPAAEDRPGQDTQRTTCVAWSPTKQLPERTHMPEHTERTSWL